MKRILIIAVTLLTSIINVNAQGYNMPANEISVSAGFGTHPLLALSFGDAFTHLLGDEGTETSYGAYSVMYLHNMNKHFALGLSATYEGISKEGDDKNKYNEDFLTFMPTARAYWFRTKGFGMYSRLAAGVSFNMYEGYEDKKNVCDTYFAFQVSPVSFEFGGSKLSAFLELGYGYQGFGNAGVRLGF